LPSDYASAEKPYIPVIAEAAVSCGCIYSTFHECALCSKLTCCDLMIFMEAIILQYSDWNITAGYQFLKQKYDESEISNKN
jgi:hypothetical protein